MPKSPSIFFLVAMSMVGIGCSEKKKSSGAPAPPTHEVVAGRGSIEAEALEPGVSSNATLFASLPSAATGIDFTHRLDLQHPLKRLYHGGFATGGIAIGDLDGDDLPDLFLVSGSASNRLYRNQGGMRFEAVESADLDGGDRWGTGVAMADVDNDGDLDLYVCNYQSPN